MMKKTDLEIHAGKKGPLMIFGGVFVALGLLAILLPVAASLTIELFVGLSFTLGGFSGTLLALERRNSDGWWLQALFGIISAGLGLSFIINPESGLISLTLLLVFVFAVEGVLAVNWAMQLRDKARRWFWILLSGMTSMALAAIVVAGLPHSATWVIGFLIGINFLTTGLSVIALAWEIED